MKFVKILLWICLSLYVMSCSGGDDFSVAKMTPKDARIAILDSVVVSVSVNDSLVVKSVSVYELDDQLKEIRKVFSTERDYACVARPCVTDSLHLQTGYMKLVFNVASENSPHTSMEFYTYFDARDDYIQHGNVYDAMLSKRVEKLVREQEYPLQFAVKIADAQKPSFLDYSDSKFWYYFMGVDKGAEIYFEKVNGLSEKLTGRGYLNDDSFNIHIADSLVSLYQNGAWKLPDDYKEVQSYADFWKKMYDFHGCGNNPDTLLNNTDGKYGHMYFACKEDRVYFPNFAYEIFQRWEPIDEKGLDK